MLHYSSLEFFGCNAYLKAKKLFKHRDAWNASTVGFELQTLRLTAKYLTPEPLILNKTNQIDSELI